MDVKSLTASSKNGLPEALATFISVDNARALVTMGELGQFTEVRKSGLAEVRQEIEACVIEGEDVLTVRLEE